MALSRLELRNSDLSGIIGGFVVPIEGDDFVSGEAGTMPDAPSRDVRLSRAKGSLGVPGISSAPWLLTVSMDSLRSDSCFNSLIRAVDFAWVMRPILVVSILNDREH